MYGQFIRDMPECTDKGKSQLWLRKCDLRIPNEVLICSAQEQAIRKNCVKYHIDKSVDSPSCRMCGETGKTISHIVSECSKLAQREYRRRHDNVARMVYWKLCEKSYLEKSEKWYLHNPQTVKIRIKTDLHTVQKIKKCWNANKGERFDKEALVIGYNQLPCKQRFNICLCCEKQIMMIMIIIIMKIIILLIILIIIIIMIK